MTYDLLKKIKERDKLYVDVNSLNCDQNVNALKVALLRNKTKEVRKLKREEKASYYSCAD